MSSGNEIDIKIAGKVDPSVKKSVDKAANETKRIKTNLDNTSKGFKDSETAGKNFGKTSTEAVTSLDDALAGAAILSTLGAIYSEFYKATEAAEQYQLSLAKVDTIADNNSASMSQIRSDISQLSLETGKDVNSLSEATYQAISASVDTADAVAFTATANELAVGGFTQTETAVDALTTAINAYGLANDDATMVSDMFIETQNMGKTTVDQLASSVGTVIPLAAAYSVNLANVSTGYAQLTKNGIDTANAGTYLRAMLNELGDASSNVSTIIYEKTGKSFSQLMDDGNSLGDVLDILGESVSGDSTQFANLWQNTRSGVGALSLYNSGADEFNETLGEMEDSAGATSEAYETMAGTTAHSKEVMTAAMDQVAISIGDSLDPAMNKLYKIGADLLEGVAVFIDDNPEVVAALSAILIGVTVAAGGIAIYTVGTKVATVATAAFNAMMEANPAILALTGIVALAAAIGAFIFMTDDATKSGEKLTKASQDQYDELEDLKSQYDDVCEKYGDTSYQASELKQKIDDLDQEFQDSKQTYGDLVLEIDELETKYSEYKDQIAKNEEIDDSCEATGNLVDRLYELADQSHRTADEKAEMEAIIEMLNESVPNLSLNYDDLIEKTATTREALLNMVDAEYQDEKYEAAKENYKNSKALLEEEKALYDNLMEQYSNSDAYKNYKNSDGNAAAFSEYQKFMDEMITITKKDGTEVEKSMRDMISSTDETIKELEGDVKEYSGEMASLKGLTDEAGASSQNWETLTSQSIQAVQGKIDELAQKYDDEYNSAKENIEKTVGLFNELELKTDITTEKMTEAWQNQTKWIDKYSENLTKAQQYGLTDGLVTSLADGSEESGQYINQIIEELDNLNTSDANELVDKLNENFNNVKEAQGDFATTVAEYKTDFTDSLKGMEDELTQSIEKFDLSKESEKAAVDTIQAYVSGINSNLSEVDIAAQAVAFSVKTQLTPKGITPYNTNTQNIEKNAKGTRSSADMFIAGEEGPELIVGAKGSRVFTAQETEAILGSQAEGNITYNIPELLLQLFEMKTGKSTFGDFANALDDKKSPADNNNNNGGGISVVYSPVYNVSGSANNSDEIQRVAKISQADFEKYMKQYEKDMIRTNFRSVR